MALEAAGGDRKLAAEALGLTGHELIARIAENQSLKVRWSATPAAAVSPADTLHREAVAEIKELGGELVDEKTAKALEREERGLSAGLAGLGLSDKAAKLAMSFHQFQVKNFNRSASIVAGGLIRRYCENEVAIDELWEEVRESRNADPVPGEVPREQYLLNAITGLTAIQQKSYKLIVDAGLTSAIIAQKMAALKSGERGGMKRVGKPGFGPKQRVEVEI